MTDVQRMVRTKTVKEVFVEKGHFLLWKPALGGKRCECFLKEHDPSWLCRECYGSGLLGGGYVTDVKPVRFQDASFEEVEVAEVQEDTTTENAPCPCPLMDEFVTLNFECDLHYHVYYGCIFKLEDRYWKVIGIEERDDDEDDTGLPTPARWSVRARKLQEFEGVYLFLQDVKEGGH